MLDSDKHYDNLEKKIINVKARIKKETTHYFLCFENAKMIIKQREELHSSKKHECPIEMENITRVCYIKTSMILKASCILESIQTL